MTIGIRRLLRNVLFDLRYGGFIGGRKATRFAHLGAKDTLNSDYSVLPLLFHDVVRDGDVFVDVGCGRGRVLNWVLDLRRVRKVYGLELDPEIAGEAARRLAPFPQVEVRAGDALANIPDDATLFYLYNPFREDLMRRFRDLVIDRFGRAGTLAAVRCVYYNCVDLRVFADDDRCIVSKIDLPDGFHPAAMVRFNP